MLEKVHCLPNTLIKSLVLTILLPSELSINKKLSNLKTGMPLECKFGIQLGQRGTILLLLTIIAMWTVFYWFLIFRIRNLLK